MNYQLRPILSEIKELYKRPISSDRFVEYISKLQGDSKGDMALPIGGFNPMAKEHVLQKIIELEKIGAEHIMADVIKEFNSTLDQKDDTNILVVLNLADDLKGGWTNYYTTDYDSKFKLNAFVSRNFCVPYFWTSMDYAKELIQKTTIEYLRRTLYWTKNGKPVNLEAHLMQEMFVYSNLIGHNQNLLPSDFDFISNYYARYKKSEEYDVIFNFLYGDAASDGLGFAKYGISDRTGIEYAQFLAQNDICK